MTDISTTIAEVIIRVKWDKASGSSSNTEYSGQRWGIREGDQVWPPARQFPAQNFIHKKQPLRRKMSPTYFSDMFIEICNKHKAYSGMCLLLIYNYIFRFTEKFIRI